ncbi:stage II sporulation protein M [Methanothermococcus okinawensis]|uniref:Stage II sporulation protein M n=1 Tax=Methanothermococcus okinawensis (strain DSM 14208 / JCM 11175 / IH1) TaxID=647113 RepID=F8AMG0_METOI|nr:stage II sporulation protein M [Methanothermococcus okinawensis]AEH06000.1 protein of unknown function DUF95 transmembrane [Methanothermococcus okinawensis IH1]
MSKTTYELLEVIYALKRQKYIIYAVTILFLMSFIISYILLYLDITWVKEFGEMIFNQFSEYVNSLDIKNESSLNIFSIIVSHNLSVGILNYILTIFSTLIIISNAFILAYVLYISKPLTFILLVLPHGIVEIPALILSSSSGIVLCNAFIKRLKKDEDSVLYYKDSLRILFVSMLLFIIAAIIESSITLEIKKLIVG